MEVRDELWCPEAEPDAPSRVVVECGVPEVAEESVERGVGAELGDVAVELEEGFCASGEYLRVGAVAGGVVFVVDFIAEVALYEFGGFVCGEVRCGVFGAVAACVTFQ